MKRKWSYVVKSMLVSPFYIVSSVLLVLAMLTAENVLIVLLAAIVFLGFTYAYTEEFAKVYDEKVAREFVLNFLQQKSSTSTPPRNCGEK